MNWNQTKQYLQLILTNAVRIYYIYYGKFDYCVFTVFDIDEFKESTI